MKRIVEIPRVGNVAFPDHMSDAEVSSASKRLHDRASPQLGIEDVLQALIKTEKGPSSKAHQKMAEVAQLLEQNPALLQLAIAGLQASSRSGISLSADRAGQGSAQQPRESQASAA